MKLAAAVAVLTGCADATGIIVTAIPADQGVKGADTLEVFVGRQTLDVTPAIHAHLDDGQAVPFRVNSFTEPTDILLSGDGSAPEFWIVVRAYDGDTVVGEGGIGHPLALVPGEVGTIDVDIKRADASAAYMPNCPGAGPSGERDYIVTDLDTDDCDFDGDRVLDGDCDDFDPSITVQNNSRYCVGIDTGECRLGTTPACGPVGGTACTPLPDSPPLQESLCQACELTTQPLLECMRDALASPVQCTIDYIPTQFCLPNGVPSLAPDVWYEDEGLPLDAGVAQWRLGGLTNPGVAYGFIDGGATFVDQSAQFPPWPAVAADGPPLPDLDGVHDSLLMVIDSAASGHQAVIFDFEFKLSGDGNTCADDPALDCQFP